jgi:cytochrome P450 family 12
LLVSNAHKANFEQVDKFIPERWLKDNTDPKCPHAKDTHPFAFLPFGFASRACIGKRMANMEIEILVARVLREFKLEWNHADLKWKSVTINYPDSPLKFKATDI